MSLITRTYSFTDGITAYGSQVDSEIANIVNTINSLNSGSTTWDIVKAVNASTTPLIADNSSGSNNIADFRANGVSKLTIGSTGGLTAATGFVAALPMGSNKITGLANGTTSTDAAAFGQIKVLQYVVATDSTSTAVTANSFTSTGLTASITPTASSSKIAIFFCSYVNVTNVQGSSMRATINRNSTNIQGTGNALIRWINPASQPFTAPATGIAYDAPATTSATTYTVAVAGDGTNGGTWNPNTFPAYMILAELA